MPDRYPQLIALLAEMGIPDRHGWLVRNIRRMVATMLVDRVRVHGRVYVAAKMTMALAVAERIVKEEGSPAPPPERLSSPD